ncbi:hypothetical protein STEG23_028650 [Scotinomys teguina]
MKGKSVVAKAKSTTQCTVWFGDTTVYCGGNTPCYLAYGSWQPAPSHRQMLEDESALLLACDYETRKPSCSSISMHSDSLSLLRAMCIHAQWASITFLKSFLVMDSASSALLHHFLSVCTDLQIFMVNAGITDHFNVNPHDIVTIEFVSPKSSRSFLNVYGNGLVKVLIHYLANKIEFQKYSPNTYSSVMTVIINPSRFHSSDIAVEGVPPNYHGGFVVDY